MIYELPELYLTATHVHFYEKKIEESRGGGFVRLTGDLGWLKDGDFQRLTEMPRGAIVRHIKDQEFAEFMEDVDAHREGAPTEGRVDFRDEDYARWLDEHGWSDERVSWTTTKPKTHAPRKAIPLKSRAPERIEEEAPERSEPVDEAGLWELLVRRLGSILDRLMFWR